MTAPVAYLVSRYPAVSHTFIHREVEGLRAQGVDVSTYSVRPAEPHERLTAADEEAFRTTATILGRSAAQIVRAQLLALIMHPRAYVGSLRRALATGPRNPRAWLWQLFYFLEAVVLLRLLQRKPARHLHVHLANNAADIARLTVDLGHRQGDEAWSWSFTMHGPTEFSDVRGSDLAAKVRDAAYVICISDFCRSQLMGLVEETHWEKLHVVHCGIDVDRFPDLRAARADRAGPLRVLNVGRLVEEKAPAVVIEAVARCRAAGQEVSLRVVGNGPLRQRLADLAAELGIAEHVELTGSVGQDTILEHYEWADVFCLPSFAEGVPVVLMEAMSTGLPVVTTAIAGIPELVEHGVTGFVLAPGRVDLVVDALIALRDPKARERFSEHTRRSVQDAFLTSTTAAQVRQLLPSA